MALTFRPIERADIKQLRLWRNSPDIRVRCREYRLLSVEDQTKWFESLLNDRSVYMLAVEAESKLIGVCGLTGINWVNSTAELSIYIGPEEERHKGYGRGIVNELLRIAFMELNLNRVWLECYEFNRPGLELFESCGFIREGILRDHVFKDGKYRSSVMMGISRKEWIYG